MLIILAEKSTTLLIAGAGFLGLLTGADPAPDRTPTPVVQSAVTTPADRSFHDEPTPVEYVRLDPTSTVISGVSYRPA